MSSDALVKLVCTTERVQEKSLHETGDDKALLEGMWSTMRPRINKLRGFAPANKKLSPLAIEKFPLGSDTQLLQLDTSQHPVGALYYLMRSGMVVMVNGNEWFVTHVSDPMDLITAADELAHTENPDDGWSAYLWFAHRLEEAWESSCRQKQWELEDERRDLAASTGFLKRVKHVYARP